VSGADVRRCVTSKYGTHPFLSDIVAKSGKKDGILPMPLTMIMAPTSPFLMPTGCKKGATRTLIRGVTASRQFKHSEFWKRVGRQTRNGFTSKPRAPLRFVTDNDSDITSAVPVVDGPKLNVPDMSTALLVEDSKQQRARVLVAFSYIKLKIGCLEPAFPWFQVLSYFLIVHPATVVSLGMA
jgi:hypothetical protein